MKGNCFNCTKNCRRRRRHGEIAARSSAEFNGGKYISTVAARTTHQLPTPARTNLSTIRSISEGAYHHESWRNYNHSPKSGEQEVLLHEPASGLSKKEPCDLFVTPIEGDLTSSMDARWAQYKADVSVLYSRTQSPPTTWRDT